MAAVGNEGEDETGGGVGTVAGIQKQVAAWKPPAASSTVALQCAPLAEAGDRSLSAFLASPKVSSQQVSNECSECWQRFVL